MAEGGRKPYFQGPLDHKQSGKKEKYVTLYVCLVGRQILIYDDFNKNKLLGRLTLDIGTKVKTTEKNGHRIELVTKDFDSKGMAVERRNVFRSEARGDRDIWYAYIHALTKGQVPSNLKISPAIIMNIQEALQDCIRPTVAKPPDYIPRPVGQAVPRLGRRPSAPVIMTQYMPEPRPDYDDHPQFGQYGQPLIQTGHQHGQNYLSTLRESKRHGSTGTCTDATDYEPIFRVPTDHKARPGPTPQDQNRFLRNSVSSGESEGSRSDGPDYQPGVYKTHQFYTDPEMNKNIPPWFFDNCNRGQAELILTVGKNYGNIMMRESTTYRDHGSYVIDFCEDTPSGCKIRHIEITRGNGFELYVEEGERKSFSCLAELMSYMTSYLGPNYRAMSTNDKTKLGIEDPDYDTVVRVKGKPTMRSISTSQVPDHSGLQSPPKLPHWRPETGYNSDSDSGKEDYLPMDEDPTKIYEDVEDYLLPDPDCVRPEEVHSTQLRSLSISEEDTKKDVPC